MKIFLTFFFFLSLTNICLSIFFFHRFQVVFQIYSPTRVVWLGRRSSIKGIPESSSNTDPASFDLGIPILAPAVNCIFLTTEYLLTKSIGQSVIKSLPYLNCFQNPFSRIFRQMHIVKLITRQKYIEYGEKYNN